ncbi:MAG TPA: serine/threonine-protein kinase [Gemmatimonadales bacterium]|nr:serine/threonine-protein kinase [Gemmatimonadales bacterium]
MPDLLDSLREALADRYAVDRELGRGGMATVFLAEDRKHGRSVAIKVLHPELSAALGAERFLREIEIAARLQHPHILPLYDSGSAAGFLYYVMPYVEGESLRDRLTREKQLGLEDAVRIATEVSGALAYAHGRGVIHRDVKPENIMLSGGTAVVADFGIARAVSAAGEAGHLTQTGTIIGTPAYMSPEQSAGSSDLDGRSDQYSLACVVYEMLVGEPPFTGPTAQAIIARHSLDMVSPPSIVRTTIPDAVEGAILRALSKTPADRYPTTALFAEALNTPSPATGAVRRATLERGLRRAGPPTWRRALPLVAAIAVVGTAAALVARRRGGSVAGAEGGVDPRHVAVLYFEDLSPKRDLAYLADGLTDALIAELTRVPGLRVVSKNGVAPYRSPDIPRDSVARALEAGTLVQGTVEEAGDRYRVTARLIEGASGADFRRASFEQPKGNLLAIRDTLADKVAAFLRERLGEEVRLRQERTETSSAAAWAAVQQGEHVRKEAAAAATPETLATRLYARADSLFTTAEALDGAWVEPILQRARVAYDRSRIARQPPDVDKALRVASSHVERALKRQPDNPDALEMRGRIRFTRYARGLEPDAAAAERLLALARTDLEDATRLNPNQAGAWTVLSRLYYDEEDLVAANRAARAAYDADAYLDGADAILSRLYATSYDLELFQPAIDWCEKGHRRFPNDARFVECQLLLLSTRAKDPDIAQAWHLADDAVQLSPERDRAFKRPYEQVWVAAVLGRAGLKDSARHVLERSRASPDLDPDREIEGYQAAVYTMLGDKETALRLLAEYLVANPRHREGFRKNVHWWWRSIQDEPRFKALIGAR